MKKINFIFFMMFNIVCLINSQEIKMLIVEKKGIVDIKDMNEQYKKLELNDVLQYGSEITTGFHSQVSIQIGENSYITVNQLSSILISNVLVNKDEITTSVTLNHGYIVVFAKPIGKIKNRIIININRSNVELSNSGCEIYMRHDKGSIIKCINGMIKIGTKLVKTYFINKDETCGILPTDILIESDYFLRRKINVKANEIYEDQKTNAYFDYIFNNYTKDINTNDYSDQVRP
jgi:hypothetical protein